MHADKLKEFQSEEDRMYLAAAEALRHCKGDIDAAAKYFRGYLLIVQKDMNSGAKPDGGHVSGAREGHELVAAEKLTDGVGHEPFAEQAIGGTPLVREPTLTEAGRVLQKARQPGAGALSRSAFETRAQVRGENWLLTYAIPNGPPLLSLTWADAVPMARRMVGEAGERAYAATLIMRLHAEGQKLGRISDDQSIGKTLPPAVVAKVAEELDRARFVGKAKASVRLFMKEHVELLGSADA